MKLRLLVLMVWLSAVCCEDACVENDNDGKQSNFNLTLPDEFSVDIEVVKADRVENMKMYYSKFYQIIRMDYITNVTKSSMYVYFKDNEILYFDFTKGKGNCNVAEKVGEIVDPLVFGGVQPKQDQTIPTPLEVFHFHGKSGFGNHDIINSYRGTEAIRGKSATMHNSCQKWSSKTDSIVLSVTHYFADQNNGWDYPLGKKFSTLLSMVIEGTGKVHDIPNEQIKYTYNYFNFKEGLKDQSVLETPDGIVCPGRKIEKKMPKLPNSIRFSSETIDYTHKEDILYVDEVYDYDRNIFIFQSSLAINTDKNMGQLTSAYDFVTGEVFRLDNKLKTCQKTLIKDDNPTPFSTTENGKLVLINPKKFFKADAENFSYLGKKMVRGMLTDTWVAQSQDIPGSPDAVVQWQFAPSGTKSLNDANKAYTTNKYPIPVRFIMWPNGQAEQGVAQNIFQVDYTPMRPDYLDLSPCFRQKRHFQLVLKVSMRDIEELGLEVLKFNILEQITEIAKVGQFRVNQMKVYYIGDNTVVEFYIGDDKRLQEITTMVVNAIQNKKITTNVILKGKPQVFEVVKVSSALVDEKAPSPPQGDSGYGAGAMAGLGVTMAIIGTVGGVAASFGHTKYLT